MIAFLWAAASLIPPPSRATLERAFSFATAIESDPKDRGGAQAAVALEALSLDDSQQAASLAERIDGWQRGVVYAEIAAWHGRAGDASAARAFIAKAEDFQRTQEGWQGPRIGAHVALARAALGEVDAARKITGTLAESDRQYNGMAIVADAGALAARGQFDAAMAEIRKSQGETDYEFVLGRASAYLDLARREGFSTEQRLEAARAARAAAEGVPVWSRADLLVATARQLEALDVPGEARQALTAAEELGRALASTTVVRAGVLSGVAEAWAALGEGGRARGLLADAEAGLPAMQAIDRPEMRARIAASTAKLEDADLARRRFDQALGEAESLVNARPRALAAVGLCRALARSGMALDPRTSDRLDALRRGLKAPW